MKLAVTAFTKKGAALALQLAAGLEGAEQPCEAAFPQRLADSLGQPGYADLTAWTGCAFERCGGLLFVGACGIAVRAIAPFIRDKLTDPAVVAVDELGRYAVPLLSGHVGGANRLARRVAALTAGTAVISTATDVNGLFAVDEWAAQQGLFLDSRAAAKHISAALLAGRTVGVQSDFPVEGTLPDGLHTGPADLGLSITLDSAKLPFPETLRLVPRILHLGIGCRRGASAEAVHAAVVAALEAHSLSLKAVKAVHTIDIKQDEPGLLALCKALQVPLLVHTARELAATEGEFMPSELVLRVTGVDNVCERAAVLGGGALLVKKQAGGGVTVAVAQEPFTVCLREE